MRRSGIVGAEYQRALHKRSAVCGDAGTRILKSIVCSKYGPPDVLRLKEIDEPVPKNNEVLIRVHAATVLMGDCELRGMNLPLSWQLIARIGFGFRGPRRKIL